MAFLRIANEAEPKRYYYKTSDGEQTDEFIELRAEISKKKAAGLLKFAPKKEDDLDGGLRFIERAFNDLILGWSLDAPATVETYLALPADAGQWVDRTVGEHLRFVLGADAQAAEGKPEE